MLKLITKKYPLTKEMIQRFKPRPIEGLPSLDFDGLVSYIKNGHAQNVAFLTGAGTSVAAGIPDFRTPKIGLYSNLEKYHLPYPEAVFTIDYFDKHPEPFFDVNKSLMPGVHQPVTAHYLPTLFQNHGILRRLYTQNIDGLDRAAGLKDDYIVEAHGSFATNTCRKCQDKSAFNDYKEEMLKGQVVHCKKCKTGIVKPDVVFFGENLPERFFNLSKIDFPMIDLFIVIGSSLKVQPCSNLPGYCRDDIPRVLINNTPVATYQERIAVDEKNNVLVDVIENSNKQLFKYNHITNRRDIYLEGDCQEICKRLIDALGWTDEYYSLINKQKENQKIQN